MLFWIEKLTLYNYLCKNLTRYHLITPIIIFQNFFFVSGDQAHEALKFDAWTKCSAGVLGQANRLSATFNQLRQANKLIGPSCARVFFFGGSGCCGSFVSLIFEVITVCELIIRFFVHSTDVISN